jgi:membrane associated rhomboid family serine protease
MQEWKPKGTWGLLIAILAVFIVQFVSLGIPGLHNYLFTIAPDWYLRPWSLITSTLAHGDLRHIFFNGLILFFFGPIAERIVGTKRFIWMFMIAGAVSGIAQVTLEPGAALGASGALMMTFGMLVILMPREKILIYGIIPVPFWVAGLGYAALDILGAFNTADGIGNFAHLSGMALGLWLGWDLKQRRRQKQVHMHWTAAR